LKKRKAGGKALEYEFEKEEEKEVMPEMI